SLTRRKKLHGAIAPPSVYEYVAVCGIRTRPPLRLLPARRGAALQAARARREMRTIPDLSARMSGPNSAAGGGPEPGQYPPMTPGDLRSTEGLSRLRRPLIGYGPSMAVRNLWI